MCPWAEADVLQPLRTCPIFRTVIGGAVLDPSTGSRSGKALVPPGRAIGRARLNPSGPTPGAAVRRARARSYAAGPGFGGLGILQVSRHETLEKPETASIITRTTERREGQKPCSGPTQPTLLAHLLHPLCSDVATTSSSPSPVRPVISPDSSGCDQRAVVDAQDPAVTPRPSAPTITSACPIGGFRPATALGRRLPGLHHPLEPTPSTGRSDAPARESLRPRHPRHPVARPLASRPPVNPHHLIPCRGFHPGPRLARHIDRSAVAQLPTSPSGRSPSPTPEPAHSPKCSQIRLPTPSFSAIPGSKLSQTALSGTDANPCTRV